MTFGSLFAGIGGLDLGLERAGMVCKWQVEIDDYATRVLERHWPDVKRWKDVKAFPPDAHDWREYQRTRSEGCKSEQEPSIGERPGCFSEELRVDLICGGFPCQDISYAGRGAGLEGARSGLFFEAIRVVRQLRPRFVLLENVAALLTRGLDRVHGELATLGYDSESHCIPAASVGAPHIRDRVFILAYSNSGTGDTRRTKSEEQRWNSEAVGDSGDVANNDIINDDYAGFRTTAICGKWQSSEICKHAEHWIIEPDVGRVADGIFDRVERLKCLGNAVVPQVAEYIGNELIKWCELKRHKLQ